MDRLFAQASQESGVPRDLLVAVAAVERGLRLPAHRQIAADERVPVAGMLELRHGAFDSLGQAAAREGIDEATLAADTDRATRAGARLLAELGAASGARAADLGSWRGALEILSGHRTLLQRHDYASRVLSLLRQGGSFPAREGETVALAAHPEIPAPEPLTAALGPEIPDTPDFPGAIWYPTPEANKWTSGRPDGNASVDTIVIHDTEGGWEASVATLQNDPGKSVHYIVDDDGSRVGQFVHEDDTAWHAGNWCYNTHSIGIEHVGFVADPGYSDGLYRKSVDLVGNIRTRWQVPLDRVHIVGHYQIPNGNRIGECSAPCSAHIDVCEASANYGGANNHRDPGIRWMWCQYMERLGGSCTCADAWDLWNCTTDLTEAVRCANGQVEIQHCTGGCTVQPIGVDDICTVAAVDAGTQPDAGGGGTGGGGDTSGGGQGGGQAGAGGGGAGGQGHPAGPGMGGGCAALPGNATGLGGLGLALGTALAAAFAARKRRRRR